VRRTGGRTRDAAKELHVVDGASHIDLYWNPEYVPQVAERLSEFFAKSL